MDPGQILWEANYLLYLQTILFPNFTPFCSTITRFPDIEVFYFSIGYNGKIAILEKISLKIRNSKFKKSQTYFCEGHWEENSGQVSKRLAAISRRSSVLKFSLTLGPMLMKTNNIR